MATIKEIRALTNLSQGQFADKYEIPRASLQNWEQGYRQCPDYLLKLLERVVREDFQKN